MVVVVEIFVTQRNTKHALCDQVAHGVFDTLLNPVIPEALTDTIQQADPLIDLAKQQSTTVTSESTAVKPADYLTSPRTVKFKLIRNTLCVHRPLFAVICKVLFALTLCTSSRPVSIPAVRFTG